MTELRTRHAALTTRTEQQLRDEHDELLVRLDGCLDPDCDHHAWAQDRLGTVRWLLGEAPA